ncbi:MAG: VOC family protein [Thermoplasmata archaeon]
MSIRVHSVAVVVRDRKKAAKWYSETLGFKVIDDDDEHWTTVGQPRRGAVLHLCEMGPHPKASEFGNTGILIVTNEALPRVYQRWKKQGVKFSEPPKKFPWGWRAKFLDPDGNELWLIPEESA